MASTSGASEKARPVPRSQCGDPIAAAKWPLYYFPPPVQPFLEIIRLDKPSGTKLFFWPFAWGLTLAAFRIRLPLPIYGLELARSLVSAFFIRSCACTINDIVDRDIDTAVERTKVRPLPSGRLSVHAASIWCVCLFVAGTLWFSFLPPTSLYFALVQLYPLSCTYPFLKRITYWPQAWLGVLANFGAIIAWTAVTELGDRDRALMGTVLAGGWCWTMLYDTIYACQDAEEDAKAGVKSTALLFGKWLRPILTLFACTFVTMLAAVGILNGQCLPYFLVGVGGTAVHLFWQLATVDLKSPSSCWANFNRNGQLGWIVWGGLFVDYVIRLGGPLPDFARTE